MSSYTHHKFHLEAVKGRQISDWGRGPWPWWYMLSSLSVRLSVTSRCCSKMAKHGITQTMQQRRWTLVFWCWRSQPNSNGVTHNGGVKCRWDKSKSATITGGAVAQPCVNSHWLSKLEHCIFDPPSTSLNRLLKKLSQVIKSTTSTSVQNFGFCATRRVWSDTALYSTAN